MHLTIKFTTDWTKVSINFSDITVSIAEGIIETDAHVQPTDSRKHLLSFSCHAFYCKKGIPYSQALRRNRICSNNEFFNKRRNQLKKYQLERGYSEKMVLEKVNHQEK